MTAGHLCVPACLAACLMGIVEHLGRLASAKEQQQAAPGQPSQSKLLQLLLDQ